MVVDVAVNMKPLLVLRQDLRIVVKAHIVTSVSHRERLDDFKPQLLVIPLLLVVVAKDEVFLTGELRGDLIEELLVTLNTTEEEIP